jgi:hypothetical protein
VSAAETAAPGTRSLSFAAGLALLGHAGLLLGLFGLLRPLPLIVLLIAMIAAGWGFRKGAAAEIRAGQFSFASERNLVFLGMFAAVAPLLILPIYPATAFDATMYHLPYAKAFASTGRLPFLADLRFPIFPQLTEVLFSVLFPVAGDRAAQCLSAFFTFLTAALLVEWGREEEQAAAGWLAAAALLGNPIVMYFGTTPYVEPALTLFATAAFYAFARWRREGSLRWLALSGFFMGTAAAVKYLGLFLVGALTLAALATSASGRRGRSFLAFLGAAAVALVPWYLRIYLVTGNPVFPYLASLFGSSEWDLSGYGPRVQGTSVVSALAILLVRFVRLPFDLLFKDLNFDSHPPFSPFWLFAFPMLAAGLLRKTRWRALIGVSCLYALFTLTLPRDPRYLFPICPVLSLAAVSIGREVFEKVRRLETVAIVAVAGALLLLPGLLYAGRDLWRRGAPPISSEGRERYLAQRLPAFPAIAFLNRTLGSQYTLYAYHSENMPFFADGRFLGDQFGPANFRRIIGGSPDTDALWQKLRALGADHLLVIQRRSSGIPIADPRFGEFFREVYSDKEDRVYALLPRLAD